MFLVSIRFDNIYIEKLSVTPSCI